MKRLAETIARLVVRRPWTLAARGRRAAGRVRGDAAARQAFDTDILNLLPADRPAGEGA